MRHEDLLLQAASEGNDRKVRALLSPLRAWFGGRVNVECRDKDDSTPLMHAAMKGSLATCALLLRRSAAVDAADREGFTALMGAAKFGHLEVVKLLLEHGANPRASKTGEYRGWGPLMFAAWQGRTEVVELLLGRGLSADEPRTKTGWTPLLFAIQQGHDQTARVLIERGADVNVVTEAHFTPLMCAAKLGRLDAARLLLDRGAALEAETVHVGDCSAGWTALTYAAWQGKTQVVELLLERGACKDRVVEGTRSTPLLLAAKEGHVDTARLLVERGAAVDARSSSDWTALMWAARDGREELVSLLVARGAPLDQRSDDGYTALGLAAWNGHLGIVKRLVEAGADVNTRDEGGASPLGDASLKNHQAVVEYLLAHGARDTREEERDPTRGLRPLGNRRRLTETTDAISYGYDARLLLFRDLRSAERCYELLVERARTSPPPFVLELMLAFMPRSIFAEKYAVVLPSEAADTREPYKKWALEALRWCNEQQRVHESTDHMYKKLHEHVEVVHRWTILVPKDFAREKKDARALLRDGPDDGHPPLRVAGRDGVAAPPEAPEPQGPWMGVLFDIGSFEEASYGAAATRLLLAIAGKDALAGCVLHGGDVLPDCRYWCSAVRTASSEQAERVARAVRAAGDAHLAPASTRVLLGPQVPVSTLPYQGFVSADGVYIGA